MENIDDKIKSRIKKLLALASSSNENEATVAMKQAMKLMAKHSISESELQKEAIESREFEPNYRVIPAWAGYLYCNIANALGCYAVYCHRYHDHPAKVTICGKNSDIEKALYIMIVSTSLIFKQSQTFREQNQDLQLSRGHMNDYRKGLAIGFCRKLKEEYSRAEKFEAEGKGLVPVDTRANDAESFYRQDHNVRDYDMTTGLLTSRGVRDSDLIDVKEPINDSSIKGRLTA